MRSKLLYFCSRNQRTTISQILAKTKVPVQVENSATRAFPATKPPVPANEAERLAELITYDVLDTEQEDDYQDLVKLASAICGTPVSLVSLIDTDRQWFKARVGLEETETSRDVAFCAHAIVQDGLFEVPDARQDDRFKNNPLVTGEKNIRFYAGMPLTTPSGNNMGTLCVIDNKPRVLDEHQKQALKTLSKQVVAQMELRQKLRQVTESREIVLNKKRQLDKSINYASRIQRAILPDADKLSKRLPQNFVIYKPRDVVSGDIYFHCQVGDKDIVAVIDCTGHGIPGAFMSMLAYNQLTQIVNDYMITDPAAIMEQLDVQVQHMLNHQGDRVNDGMDVSLFCYDRNTETLEISGAKGKTFLSMGKGDLTSIRLPRHSIGRELGGKKIFSSTTVKLEKPTTIYMTTDGYTDQFGGESGRKFTTKRLRDILKLMADESMAEQKAVLQQELESWMKGRRQLDDILLLGVKFE